MLGLRGVDADDGGGGSVGVDAGWVEGTRPLAAMTREKKKCEKGYIWHWSACCYCCFRSAYDGNSLSFLLSTFFHL